MQRVAVYDLDVRLCFRCDTNLRSFSNDLNNKNHLAFLQSLPLLLPHENERFNGRAKGFLDKVYFK